MGLSVERFNNQPRQQLEFVGVRGFDKSPIRFSYKPAPIEPRMRGIEDLMHALDERPLTIAELFKLVSEYKETISTTSPSGEFGQTEGVTPRLQRVGQ